MGINMLKDDIISLYKTGMTNAEISRKLNCSRASVSYYTNPDTKINKQKEQNRRRNKWHPYKRKSDNFKREYEKSLKNTNLIYGWEKLLYAKIKQFTKDRSTNTMQKANFSVKDVINKFGENPKCYLTGDSIDIYQPRTYHFDHIIPVSKGGDNSIDNLGICTRDANYAKSDLTLDEFINLCKKVVNNLPENKI